jgi:hypothetical protein
MSHYQTAPHADLRDQNGRLGRPVPTGQVLVPQVVKLKDARIHWRMGNPQMREVSPNMLNQFIRLTDADSVLQFAKSWGILALSENLWKADDPEGQFYLPGRRGLQKGIEPVSVWQYYSKRAQAVLNVAAALRRGKLGDISDWGAFANYVQEGGDSRSSAMRWLKANMQGHRFGLGISLFRVSGTDEERLDSARNNIAREIEGWLDCWKRDRDDGISDFTLRWLADQRRWELQIDYHGLLFPAIALQLALVVADADSLYSCSGCGRPYIRTRERKRPKAGWGNYCDQCLEDGVAQRRAVETYRQKRAEAVRLHVAGMSDSEIAERLCTEPDSVHTWIEKGDKGVKTKARK